MSKLESVTTLEDLAGLFQMKLTTIRQCVQLRDAGGDPAVNLMMTGVEHALTELQAVLAVMRAEISQRRKALNAMEQMRTMAASLQEQVDHATANIPARLPKKQVPRVQNNSSNKENSEAPEAPVQNPRNPLSESVQNINGGNETRKKSVKSKKSIPSIEYLTVVEFDSVPKYMRGRLTYDKVNAAIDELNKAVSKKYALVNTKRTAQTNYIKNKILSYKEQETKDTTGIHFIGDTDIKEFSALKVDNICRSLLTVIRHSGRIREIRGGGMTRYAVCQ